MNRYLFTVISLICFCGDNLANAAMITVNGKQTELSDVQCRLIREGSCGNGLEVSLRNPNDPQTYITFSAYELLSTDAAEATLHKGELNYLMLVYKSVSYVIGFNREIQSNAELQADHSFIPSIRDERFELKGILEIRKPLPLLHHNAPDNLKKISELGMPENIAFPAQKIDFSCRVERFERPCD
jgi:hypothetical protein